ncbi:hypothetical protein AB0R12_26010, partial [Streptomyces niveus]|uniref:hypothetical protein n=1 Tax=Streptomyces niveus TaxID=193462 RepID=UPI003423F237
AGNVLGQPALITATVVAAAVTTLLMGFVGKVGDDVPEELPDRRTGSYRVVPGLLGFGVRIHGQRSLLEHLGPTTRRLGGS